MVGSRTSSSFAARVAPLALLGLAACSPEPAAVETIGRVQQQLVGGAMVATAADTPDLVAVGRLVRLAGGGGVCSGTLIAPRVMLTAAHCVFNGAMGCSATVGPTTAIFADANGDPTPGAPGVQAIDVVGIVAHPDAYGDRVSSCPAPPTPINACPDAAANPAAFNQASCALLDACFPTGIGAIPCIPNPPCMPGMACTCTNREATFQAVATMNFHGESDLALVFLAAEPVGITPMPLLTYIWDSPSDNIFKADMTLFAPWIAEQPLVTIAGYGQGNKANATRDVGTQTLLADDEQLSRGFDCAGNALGTTREDIWIADSSSNAEADTVPGDSGGPMFFGADSVPMGVPAPTALPDGTGLTEQRYVVGVVSTTTTRASLFNVSNAWWLVTVLHDFDADGIPNEQDNCVAIANPNQANCNADAERDRSGAVLGDACDPVPCPYAEANISQQTTENRCALRVLNTRRDKIQLKTIASHNSFNGVEVPESGVSTSIRYCQRDLRRSVNCGVNTGQRTDDAFGILNPAGIPGQNWLPMTVAGSTSDKSVDYPAAPPEMFWRYADDKARWLANTQINTPEAAADSLGLSLGAYPAGLDGVMGLRSSSTLGSQTSPDNGVHPSPPAGGVPQGGAMARYYRELAPETRQLLVNACAAFDPLWRDKCPMCERGLPRFPDCPVCEKVLRPRDDWWSSRPFEPILTIPGLRGRWGILDKTGGFLLPPGVFSPGLLAALRGTDSFFVPRSEATTTRFGSTTSITTLNAPVQGVFVSRDGTKVRGIVRATDVGYQLDGEQQPVAHGGPGTQFSVALPEGATLNDLALGTLGGELKVGDRARVVTPSGAGAKVAAVLSTVQIGADAKVGGLFSTGSVTLRDRARVEGSLTTEETLLGAPNGVVITGAVKTSTAISPLDVTWSTSIPTTTQGAVRLEQDSSLSIAPGSFAAVHVKSRSTLSLRSGAYYFDSLFLEPQSVLDMDNRNGPIYVYLRQGLTFRGRIAERSPSLPNLLFIANGSEPIFVEATFRGALVAPNAALTLRKGATEHLGVFLARSIEVAPEATIRRRAFVRPDCTEPDGCLGGWEAAGASAPTVKLLPVAPRQDFGSVYSSKLRALYLIGGRYSTGGNATGEIVLHRIDLGSTELLPVPGYTPSIVLAAGANDVDGSIWILDDRTNGGVTTRRLARLNPAGHAYEIVWEGPADQRYDAHWLVSGQNGAMIVYSSSRSVGRHVALRVQAQPFVFGGSRFWLERDASGTLAGQPIAGEQGTTGYLLDNASGRIDRVNVTDSEGTEVADPSTWL